MKIDSFRQNLSGDDYLIVVFPLTTIVGIEVLAYLRFHFFAIGCSDGKSAESLVFARSRQRLHRIYSLWENDKFLRAIGIGIKENWL